MSDDNFSGVPTTIDYHKLILDVEVGDGGSYFRALGWLNWFFLGLVQDFRAGKVDTAFIVKHEQELAGVSVFYDSRSHHPLTLYPSWHGQPPRRISAAAIVGAINAPQGPGRDERLALRSLGAAPADLVRDIRGLNFSNFPFQTCVAGIVTPICMMMREPSLVMVGFSYDRYKWLDVWMDG